jgi:hypothetical protein
MIDTLGKKEKDRQIDGRLKGSQFKGAKRSRDNQGRDLRSDDDAVAPLSSASPPPGPAIVSTRPILVELRAGIRGEAQQRADRSIGGPELAP